MSDTTVSSAAEVKDRNIKIIISEIAIAAIGSVVFLGVDVILSSDWSWLQFWFWLSIAYIALTPRWWDPIGPDELGVRTRFGEPIDVLQSGLPFIPPGVYSLVKFSTLTRQREFPAEPENIYRPKEGETELAPEGKKPPIRVTFRSAISDEQARATFGDDYEVTRPDGKVIRFNHDAEDDGLNKRRLTAELTPIARWRVRNGIKYVKNIGSEPEVERQLEDELVSVLARICPQISASQAKANMEWLNELLRSAAVRRVGGFDPDRSDGWGIEMEGAYLKPINFNHSLNSEIADVVEADFRKRSTITDAEAERVRLEEEGAGAAKAAEDFERKTRQGKAAGYKSIAKATGLSGPQVAQLETAEAVGKAPSNTIFAGDSGVGSIAALAGAGFRATQKDSAVPGSPAQPSETDDKAHDAERQK